MNWPEISAKEEVGPERTVVRLQLPSQAKQDLANATPQNGSQKTPQKTPQKILDAIRRNPYVGTQEMADLFGVERSTIARAVAKLKLAGVLRRVGPDKGGHWEVIEKSES